MTDRANNQFIALVGSSLAKKDQTNVLLNAKGVELISKFCGFDEIIAAERVGNLQVVYDDKGQRKQVSGTNVIFSERVLDKVERNKQCAEAQPADICLIALFDFLVGSCDRTSSNFFVTKKGRVKLIDNLDSAFNSYAYSWGGGKLCFSGLRSVFIRQFVDADKWEWPRKPSPCLDYRCHAFNGTIGVKYPPIFSSCIANLSSTSDSKVWQTFQLPTIEIAARLRERAKWLLDGFEEAVSNHYNKYGKAPTKNMMTAKTLRKPDCHAVDSL